MHNLVPHFILENYSSGKSQGSFPAVGMFVDISGFSHITDKLMEHGQHGAEVLADVMRSIFSPLVQDTYEHGGFISTLAGDAFTAIFPIMKDQEIVSLHALAAAWQIQQDLELISRQSTPYGEFVISGKVGIALGDAAWGIVTSADEKRAVYYVEGSAVEESAIAEGKAKAGEILVNSRLHSVISESLDIESVGDLFQVTGLAVEPPPPELINQPSPNPEYAYRFFPRNLFHEGYSGEFRQVVTMFINLPTVRTEDQLAIFMGSLFDLQDKFGGLLTRLDFGDKGSNILLFWGAPVSFENDIERALNFILELQILTSIPINAGITYQIAHAGFIGSALREEYSTYGRGVNLAARFMAAAQRGDIWIDEEIAKRAAVQFEIEHYDELSFKGFGQKQKIFLLEERKETAETIFKTKMVGRQRELEQLKEFVQPLSENKYCGGLVVIGEPGIGKTRLVHEFKSISEFDNTNIRWSICQCDQAIREPLNPIRYWLRKYFSISSFQNEARNKRNFNRRLDRLIGSLDDEKLASDLDRTRTFLGALLDLHWPDSLYEQVDPQGRYDNTFIGLINLIIAESTFDPQVIHIEDAQWLDEDSWQLLAQLDRTIQSDETRTYPIAIIATARIELSSTGLADGMPYQELRIGELTQEHINELTDHLLNGISSNELMDLIIERADGNPFFAEQIVQYLQEENLIREGEGEWVISDHSHTLLPDDIRALLVSRLDRLTNEVKQVVLTAAVLGREFELQILSYMLEGDAALLDKVSLAEQYAIWSKINELRYLFNQALLLDAAYRMQVHSRRQELHELAVDAIEGIYPQELSLHSTDLAYHCEMAGLVEKAQVHMIEAANAAKWVYQNTQAVDYLTRALKLTPDEDYQSRYKIILERERIFSLLGKQDKQLQDLEDLNHLLEIARDELPVIEKHNPRTEVVIEWANYKIDMGDFEGAIESAQEILSIAEQANTTEDVDEAYFFLSLNLYHHGDYSAASIKGTEGLSFASTNGNRDSESRLLNLLGLIALEQGNATESRNNFKRSLSIAEELGELRDQARSVNNLGNEALAGGNFSTAQEYYEQALKLVRKIGARAREGLVLSNLGYIAGILGDYSTARERNDQSLQYARQVGNRIQEAYALINVSSVHRALNEYPEALSQANQGLSITREIGDRNGEAWSLTSLGNTYFELGDLETAGDAYTDALELRQKMSQQNLTSELLAGQARIALKEGNLKEALTFINPIIMDLDQGGTLEGTEDPIRVYLTCYQVLNEMNDPRSGLILEAGYNLLQSRSAGITDAEMQKDYFENIPHNLELLAEWKSYNG